MEALILSCGTGGGHNAAGKAIVEELARRGHHAEMLNPYTLQGDILAGQIDEAYIVTATKTPKAFGAIYEAGQLYRKLPFHSPVYFLNRRMVPVMGKYFSEHPVDIVIMPHLFPAEILTHMKRDNMEIPKTLFVATDYCCIPFTEETECDAYVTPGQELEADFTVRGIPRDKIYPYGIPTQSDFAKGGLKEEAKRRLNLDGDRKYILIAGGSMGAGQIEKLIGLLLEEGMEQPGAGLVVVCGSNHKLYEKLEKEFGEAITVIGHTDCMAEYMKASDLYITKPGGLSSTEAAISGIPLLHMPPIPGCETFNARYFLEHGMSMSCDITKRGAEAVWKLLGREEDCAAMVECQKKYIRKGAAARICDLAENMVSGWKGESLKC